jgi:hypothetical protein
MSFIIFTKTCDFQLSSISISLLLFFDAQKESGRHRSLAGIPYENEVFLMRKEIAPQMRCFERERERHTHTAFVYKGSRRERERENLFIYLCYDI